MSTFSHTMVDMSEILVTKFARIVYALLATDFLEITKVW